MTHPPKGIGPLRTADDLRDKLRHDSDRLRADPLDAYAAFDFFVTSSCLVDWWIPVGQSDPAQVDAALARRSVLYKREALLLLSKDIGNRSKHLVLTDGTKGPEVAGRASVRLTGEFTRECSRECDVRRLEVRDAADHRVGFDVLDLAQQVMAFWDAQDLTRPWSPP